MPLTCGIDLNINNLKGEITSKLSGFVNLSGTLGTPAGLAAIKATLEGAITSITGKLESLIPAIPIIPQSLREDLAALAVLPVGSVAALAKIAQFAEDYLGLTDIEGFADINLNDLASSVFSVTGTFDPCSAVSNALDFDIPNIIIDPVTGALQELTAVAPKMGLTKVAVPTKEIQEVINAVELAFEDNKDTILTIAAEAEKQATSLAGELQPELEKVGEVFSGILSNIQTNIETAPPKGPITETITLKSGKIFAGLISEIENVGTDLQEWTEEDADEFLGAVEKVAAEGKIMHGALMKTVATELKNFEKVADQLKNEVEEWREEVDPPGAFDDPSSLKYLMLEEKAKLEKLASNWSGLSIFQRT
jgi:hypothetical protein